MVKPSNDTMDDLQCLLDRIQLEGSRNDPSAVEQVAENLRLRLNLRVDQCGEHIFHSLAAQLLNVNLKETGKGNDTAATSESIKMPKSPRGEPQLQSTWSTETSSTSSSIPERVVSPNRACPTIVIETSSENEGNPNAGRRPSRSSALKFTSDKLEEGRPKGMLAGSLRRSVSPIRNGRHGQDASVHSPANAPLLSRSMEDSGLCRKRNSLKPPMSPFPSTLLSDSFGSSQPATPTSPVSLRA